MKFRNSVSALVAAATLFGCATSSTHGVTIKLVPTPNNADQIGEVTLTSQGKQTGLSFFISGVPDGAILPLSLYTFINKGSCQQPGPVAYAMNEQVNTERQPIRGWTVSRIAPVALSELLAGQYSIVLRSAPEDGNVDIFCGDIKQAAPAK